MNNFFTPFLKSLQISGFTLKKTIVFEKYFIEKIMNHLTVKPSDIYKAI
jgi:hypothetical protein